jgi:FtsZ-binding cell division protein ZapB
MSRRIDEIDNIEGGGGDESFINFTWIIIGGILLAIVIIIAVVISFSRTPPTETPIQQIEDVLRASGRGIPDAPLSSSGVLFGCVIELFNKSCEIISFMNSTTILLNELQSNSNSLTITSNSSDCCKNNTDSIALIQLEINDIEISIITLNDNIILNQAAIQSEFDIIFDIIISDSNFLIYLNNSVNALQVCCANNTINTLNLGYLTNVTNFIQIETITLQTEIDVINSNITSLQGCCDNNTANINVLYQNIADIQNQVDNITIIENFIQTEVDTINLNLTSQQSCCNNNTANINIIYNTIQIQQGILDNNTDNINALLNTTILLQSEIDSILSSNNSAGCNSNCASSSSACNSNCTLNITNYINTEIIILNTAITALNALNQATCQTSSLCYSDFLSIIGAYSSDFIFNVGFTNVTGNLVILPGPASGPPGPGPITGSNSGFPPGTYTGTVIDYTNTSANASATILNEITIFTNCLNRQACNGDITLPNIAGLTLTPGIYCSDNDVLLNGNLILDGMGLTNPMWEITGKSNLIISNNSTVTIINTPNPCNVFWNFPSGSANIGTDSYIEGVVMAEFIVVGAGTTITRQAMALNGQLILNTNNINTRNCSTVITCPPILDLLPPFYQ